jgi:hypothetical protein
VQSVEIRDAATDVAAGADAAAAAAPAVPRRFSGEHRFRPREPPAGATTAAELLHAQGWVRLERPPLAVDASTLEAIRAAEYQPIFNGQPADEAPLRHMGRSREWATAFEATFTDALRDAGLLVCADGVREKVVCDCYALRSLGLGAAAHDPAKGDYEPARVGRQPPHSDAPEPPSADAPWPLPDADMPLSAMLGVMPGTAIWVFPTGCAEEACAIGDDCDAEDAFLLPIGVGEIVVWRGDLVHAGAGYAEPEHFRVHAYVDPPAEIYERPKGKTNRCPSV